MFTNVVPSIINDLGVDEQLLQLRTPNPETFLDASQSQTRKVHALVDEHTAEEPHSRNFNTQWQQEAIRDCRRDQLAVSSTDAGRPPKQLLLTLTGMHAREKLPHSYSVGHVQNLLVRGEN